MIVVDASRAAPLLLLGRARRAALQNALMNCIEAWRRRWSSARDPISIELMDAPASGARSIPAAGIALTVASAAHDTLIQVRAGPDIMTALLGGMACAADASSCDPHQPLLQEMQLEVLRSLCTDMAAVARIHDVTIQNTAASWPLQGGSRLQSLTAAVTVGSGRARLAIMLSAHFVELLVPRQPSARASDAPARRRAAIDGETVVIEAVLGDVEVCLSDLVQLAEGDVIVLDQPLSGAARLTMPDGRHVANVVLGSAGAHRAVSVIK